MNSAMSEKRSMTESQKPPNLLIRPGLGRDLAVDEVEDVGDDHDDAGGDELPAGQVHRRPRVDEHADEREDVRVDPERHARGDDRAQREHADLADEPGKRHVADIITGSNRCANVQCSPCRFKTSRPGSPGSRSSRASTSISTRPAKPCTSARRKSSGTACAATWARRASAPGSTRCSTKPRISSSSSPTRSSRRWRSRTISSSSARRNTTSCSGTTRTIPYLQLTTGEAYPRVLIARSVEKDGHYLRRARSCRRSSGAGRWR